MPNAIFCIYIINKSGGLIYYKVPIHWLELGGPPGIFFLLEVVKVVLAINMVMQDPLLTGVSEDCGTQLE